MINRRTVIQNLKGIFTGNGFHKKNGRRVDKDDTGFIKGPITIVLEADTKKVLDISKSTVANEKDDLLVDGSHAYATSAFYDSHTHSLFGGSRWNEFFDRWEGKSYLEINEAGGGIRKTFRDTAACSDEELLKKLHNHLDDYSREGVNSVEIKTGYGASVADELRYLRLLKKSKHSQVSHKTTFLALHAIPQTMNEKTWTDQMITALDVIASEKLADFVDAFPEKGFFSLKESKRFFVEAIKKKIKIKIHADELTHMGAAELGIELGAVSIDHLQKISDVAVEKLSSSPTIATLLPATSFYLGLEFAPARKILAAGARVALATDFNPGTAPTSSIRFTARLAASQMKMNAAEIFCALSYNAAAAMGFSESRGAIVKNEVCDLAVWKCETSEPLEEILLSPVPVYF